MQRNLLGKLSVVFSLFFAPFLTAVSAAAISLEIQSIEERIDGIETRYVRLSGAGFDGRYYADGSWVVAETVSQGASVTFSHRLVEGVFMDLMIYPGFPLIEDYSEDSIRAYAVEIKKQYLSLGLDAVNLKAKKSPIGGASFMGRAYWRVRFDVMNPNTKKTRMSVCDFISIGGRNQNFRLRFYGEPEAFHRLSSGFESYLWDFIAD